MTIPNFKSVEDWQAYERIFIARWDAKKALLERVRDDMFPGCCGWSSIPPKAIAVINDIVHGILYDTDYDFEQQCPAYKKDLDDIFVSRDSLKDLVASAVSEAMRQDSDDDYPKGLGDFVIT